MGWFDMGNRPDTVPMARLDGSAEVSRCAAAVDLAFICATILVLHIAPRHWINSLLGTSEPITASTVNVVLNLAVGMTIAVGLMLVRGSRLESLGIRTSQVGAQVIAGLWAALSIHALTLSLFIAEYVLPLVARWWSGGAPAGSDQVADQAEMASSGSVGATLAFFAIVAVEEELLFRGLLLRYLAYLTRDRWVAILVSSLVFAVLHLPAGGQGVLVALWTGLVLGSYFMRKGSLLTVIVAHFLYNVSQWWISRL